MNQAANRTARMRAPSMPFGEASIRPVLARVDGRTTTGFLVTGGAGADRPAIVGIAGAFRETKTLFGAAFNLASDFDLLLVEMPGINGTGPAVSARVETFASHVVDLVAAELPGRDILLLGESFGAAVAMEAALWPGFARVRGLALIDPPLSYAAQLRIRDYMREAAKGFRASALFKAYIDGDGFICDSDPDAYWRRLRQTGQDHAIAILAGGLAAEGTKARPATLFPAEDESTAQACGLDDLAVVRLPHASHVVLEDAPEQAHRILRAFFLARCRGDLPAPGAIASAFARAPEDAGLRENLMCALRASPAHARQSLRDVLLAILVARPNDGELLSQIMRVLAPVYDAKMLGALREAMRRSTDPDAEIWAGMHVAVALFGVGDADGALEALRAIRTAKSIPPRLSSLILNLELYSGSADDRSVAHAKEAHLRRIRTLLPAVSGPSAPRGRHGRRTRIGFVSASFGLRNYSSLLVPFLRALADGPFDVALLSLGDAKLDHLRAVLPARIEVRELGVLTPDAIDRPQAWMRANEALAAQALDLLVDLDESLASHSPACVVQRPAPVQATWFNMSGPSLDPCFDAAIGPDTLYPPELDAMFAGRLARLPGDLYVFEPEAWEGQGFRLPPVGPPPMLANGHVTFGSLSNPYKVSDACIALWARVLHAVPRARFYLGNELGCEPSAVARVRAQFMRCGVDPARIDCRHHSGWPGYVVGYSRIDIVLGTYPVAGGTTLFEALHLGMPVLSRTGATSLGRIGRWLAAATGRPRLVHESDDSFVAEAVRLAASPDELARLRRDEPDRLRAKSRVDAVRMARAFEALVGGQLLRPAGRVA